MSTDDRKLKEGTLLRRGFGGAEWLLVVGILLVIAYVYFLHAVPAFSDAVDRAWTSIQTISLEHGYLGAVIASFVGNAAVAIPVPYTAIIFLLGALGLNPYLLGLSGGIGAGFGEGMSYLVGVAGRSITRHKYEDQISALEKLAEHHKRFISLLLFVASATPLPDDLFIVPLGFIRYGFWRMVWPVVLGKMVIVVVLALLGTIPGISHAFTSGEGNATVSSLTLFGVVGVLYLLVKIDWETVANRGIAAGSRQGGGQER